MNSLAKLIKQQINSLYELFFLSSNLHFLTGKEAFHFSNSKGMQFTFLVAIENLIIIEVLILCSSIIDAKVNHEFTL